MENNANIELRCLMVTKTEPNIVRACLSVIDSEV